MMNFDREQHFEDIYDRYYKRVYKFAYARLGKKQDAEDIANDVFEIYYSKLDTLRTHDSHGGWLLEAAKILIKAYYSRIKKRPQESMTEDFVETPL